MASREERKRGRAAERCDEGRKMAEAAVNSTDQGDRGRNMELTTNQEEIE